MFKASGSQMRIFKNKPFHRWAKEVRISDNQLKEAINDIDSGLYEANLGGNVFKKRVGIDGRGKNSGARTIIAFKAGKNSFFIYGYAKNSRSNISEQEEVALKKLAKLYFRFSDENIEQTLKSGELIEVK